MVDLIVQNERNSPLPWRVLTLAPYFLNWSQTEYLMDLLIIILSFFLAYGVFVVIALKLAKILFPKIEDEDLLTSDMEKPSKRIIV